MRLLVRSALFVPVRDHAQEQLLGSPRMTDTAKFLVACHPLFIRSYCRVCPETLNNTQSYPRCLLFQSAVIGHLSNHPAKCSPLTDSGESLPARCRRGWLWPGRGECSGQCWRMSVAGLVMGHGSPPLTEATQMHRIRRRSRRKRTRRAAGPSADGELTPGPCSRACRCDCLAA